MPQSVVPKRCPTVKHRNTQSPARPESSCWADFYSPSAFKENIMTDNNPSEIIDRVHRLEDAIRKAIKAIGTNCKTSDLKCLEILETELNENANASALLNDPNVISFGIIRREIEISKDGDYWFIPCSPDNIQSKLDDGWKYRYKQNARQSCPPNAKITGPGDDHAKQA